MLVGQTMMHAIMFFLLPESTSRHHAFAGIISPKTDRFLPRDMHKHGLCRRAVSVCPSVRLSVTFVYCVEMTKYILELFYHLVDPPFSDLRCFSVPSVIAILQGGPPNWGVEWRWRMKKIAIFDQYLALG